MTSTRPDENPYAPPTSRDAATAFASHLRTRWRAALVTLLLIFALIGLAGAPITLWGAHRWPVDKGGGLTSARIVGVLLQVAGSILIGWCGVVTWQTRWRVAVAVFGGALAALALSRWLLADLPV